MQDINIGPVSDGAHSIQLIFLFGVRGARLTKGAVQTVIEGFKNRSLVSCVKLEARTGVIPSVLLVACSKAYQADSALASEVLHVIIINKFIQNKDHD